MITIGEVFETNEMIWNEHLDVRTITLGISLLDCITDDLEKLNENIYKKITETAKDLVKTGDEIGKEFGIPIVNKRISVTPIAIVGNSACKTEEDFVSIAKTLDRAAVATGVNFIGGYSALVCKGSTPADKLLIRSIPRALKETEHICSSINLGSTRTGINMDAVKLMGEIIKEAAELTKERDSIGCAKLVVFCNLSIGDVDFFSDALEGVSRSGNDVVVLIIKVYGVQQHAVAGRLIGSASLGHEFVIACGLVEGVELIELDEFDELVGIAWVGGISGCLQPACPSFVVGAVELKEAAVAAILL